MISKTSKEKGNKKTVKNNSTKKNNTRKNKRRKSKTKKEVRKCFLSNRKNIYLIILIILLLFSIMIFLNNQDSKNSDSNKSKVVTLGDYTLDEFYLKNLKIMSNKNKKSDVVVDITNNSNSNYETVFFKIEFIGENKTKNEYIAVGGLTAKTTTNLTLVSSYDLSESKSYKLSIITENEFIEGSRTSNNK